MAQAEATMGIICACMPAFGRFLKTMTVTSFHRMTSRASRQRLPSDGDNIRFDTFDHEDQASVHGKLHDEQMQASLQNRDKRSVP